MFKYLDDRKTITALWREAFGDSEEEIAFFLDNVRHAQCTAIVENGETKAMLFLVDCALNGVKAKYIYAACTAEAHRGKGYMSALLCECVNREALLCLIPADDGLVQYYSQRGFNGKTAIGGLLFDESPDITEYLLEGYHLTEPKVLYTMR